ncbi:MAG TPA: hybrid sensor histidine kinase/response regulator [Gammaproteobacteria bacterium]|nr:hybrid sensor histidine kinase/response regulator [Gammaproteobacteria bacterium]
MDLDPALLKQLIETFQVELEEQLQVITDALLILEKSQSSGEAFTKQIERLFRAAHNIKGTARSINIQTVADIAHQLESLFSCIQKNMIALTPDRVDLCLDAVDGMRGAMQAFVERKSLNFDFNTLIARLQAATQTSPQPDIQENIQAPTQKKLVHQAGLETDTIRVSLPHLDRISALMEEMQISKLVIDDHYQELAKLSTQARQFCNTWNQNLLTISSQSEALNKESLQKYLGSNSDFIVDLTDTLNHMQKNMRPHINELNVLNNTLQEEIRLLRLVPAAALTCTLPRAVRDLAQELRKKVEFEIKGEEVKIDKLILEGLKDPLLHLLRNAIDHGIETAELRREQGKNETGKIKLQIDQEGNHILFKISDDGKGIDIKKVVAVALQKNIVTENELETMKPDEILHLIFHPGFSTRETVTAVSGRGVGLDVVRTNLDNLKGHIKVETKVNQGTTFTLRLPLTLSSERGLLISCGNLLFILPTSSVERVIKLDIDKLIYVEASQAILLDEHPVALRSLATILNLVPPALGPKEQLSLVVIHKGRQLVALMVDEIIGEREIVIKPLKAPLNNVPCVVGGTLAGSGQVIIVLNPSELISNALHFTTTGLHFQKEKKQLVDRPHILVVDDSITTRTLEKNALESKDYQVTVAVNGKEAWDLLQKQKFSLLITDVSMPIMDGFSLTERVKQSPELKNMPVIIVTSLGSDNEKKRGMEVGANAYIVKSDFESSQLLEIISQLV